MNLLAHAVLSPDHKRILIGNVLADFIGRKDISDLDQEIRQGVELHRRIDRFTDHHEAVANSHTKLVGFRRYANPLVDVFYDHFLVRHWNQPDTVEAFVGNLYGDIQAHRDLLPEDCFRIAQRMIEQDWMRQYGTFDGLARNLGRMESRIEWVTSRKVDLVSSLKILEERYEEFEADFLQFWPELRAEILG